MIKTYKFLILLCCLLLASSAFADDIAITGGTVVIGNGEVIENGVVLISDGRIVFVGKGAAIPPATKVIDATGKVVFPGMVDPYTSLGMGEVSAVPMTNNGNERTSTNTAHLRASDGIDPLSSHINVTRMNGITTALVSPGEANPINGLAVVVNLEGRTKKEMLIADEMAIILNFGATRGDSYPATLPGVVSFIRQTFYDVQAEMAKKNGSGRNLKNENLIRALKGEIPVIASADSIQEITNAIAVAQEFKLKMILLDPREGWKLLPEIKASGYPVLLNSVFSMPGERDPYDRYYKLAASFYKAGIPFAFTTRSSSNARNLPNLAAMSVAFGLPEKEAVKALAFNAARFLGIDKNYGSIEDGKIANIAIWSGSPLQIRSKVEKLFINGKEVELRSRQEMLRDRFQHLN